MKQPYERETVETDSHHVSCDGGKGPLGHPLVYLTMNDHHEVICPYCDKKFVYHPQARAPVAEVKKKAVKKKK